MKYGWDRYKPWIIVAGVLFLFVHFYPFYSPMVLFSSDYLGTAASLSYLGDPSLYSGGGILSDIYGREVSRTPLYYNIASVLYGAVDVLNIPKIIGFVFALATFLLSGGWWRDWRDGIRAVCVTVFFVHLAGSVNPMLGLGQSVMLPGILLFLHPVSRRNEIIRWLGLIVVSGIYPPAGVFLLGLTALEFLVERKGLFDHPSPIVNGLKFFAYPVAFSAGVLPLFVNNQFFNGITVYERAGSLFWSTDSWGGLFRTFVAGGGRALFKVGSSFEIFAVFLGLSLAGYLLVRRSERGWIVPVNGSLLILSGILLWGLANFFYPLLNGPGRYSRVSLLLGVMFIWAHNLPAVGYRLRILTGRWLKWRYLSHCLGAAGIGVLLYGMYAQTSVFNRLFLYREWFWPAMVAGVGLLIWGLGLRVTRRKGPFFLVVVLSLFIMVAPHGFGLFHDSAQSKGADQAQWALLRAIGQTRPGSVIAGPAPLLNAVPAYASRDVYFNQSRESISKICRRSQDFTPVYFAPDRRSVVEYFKETPVTHIVVNRRFYGDRRYYECGGYRLFTGIDPFLDRSFESPTWSRGDWLYLISREDLSTSD